jgi:TonB family protein
MKRILLLLLLCLLGWGSAFAQDVTPSINASSCEKPDYPVASKRLTEEGTVHLRFLVGVDGKVVESAIEKSSGFRRLDEAAIQGLSKCAFKPRTKDGVAVESWASMKYTWRLEVATPCVGMDVSKWRTCLGTLPTPNGGLSVIEYEAGKKKGRGIEYDKSGNVIRAGIFEGENLVSERTLDIKLYPFIAQLPANLANQSVNKEAVRANISTSNLPVCQGDKSATWNDCVGTFNYFYGAKDVNEYQSGTRNGQGIEYDKNGFVLRSGTWRNNQLVSSHAVDKTRVPFDPQTLTVATNNLPAYDSNKAERDRLALEVEQERRKRQELEEQLRVAQQSTQPDKQPVTSGKERRVALVVGNSNYKVRPLKNPRNDADDVSRSLKATGFDVIDLRDATLPQMRTAVRQFGDRLIYIDVGLVYYSGHGVEVKGRNYFIPVNADIQREDEIADQGLDVSLILEKMSTAGKGVNILIVDACRDDPFGRSFRSSSRGLANMDAPRGTIIAYATSPGKVASDGDPRERNSPYTKHLVKAMQLPNKPIEQVFKEVRRAVQDETKNQQTPWENTSLSGDFYFRIQK